MTLTSFADTLKDKRSEPPWPRHPRVAHTAGRILESAGAAAAPGTRTARTPTVGDGPESTPTPEGLGGHRGPPLLTTCCTQPVTCRLAPSPEQGLARSCRCPQRCRDPS